MCGIVGFVGKSDGTSFILEGLRKLKYRGYDSAGLSVFINGKLQIIKKKGKLSELEKELSKKSNLSGNCALGHTRWATHGKPSDLNAHPIRVNDVVVVHNGIIENYLQLKKKLKAKGYIFKTDTDTEVIAALIDSFFDANRDNCLESIRKATEEFEGTFAIGVAFSNHSDLLFAAKRSSALMVGFGDSENYIASDITAFSNKSKNYSILDDDEFCVLSACDVKFFNSSGEEIKKQILVVDWNILDSGLNNFDSFLMKEIFEQPEVVFRCFNNRIKNGVVDFSCDGLSDDWFSQFERIKIVACGTAMHAGLFGKNLIEKFARLPVEVLIASEFRYSDPVILKNDLVIIVSQSGETADSLAALNLVNSCGACSLAIVNVKTSSIARQAKKVVFTDAGVEVSVASTKAFSSQLAIFYLLALKFAQVYKKKSNEEINLLCQQLLNVPKKMELVLQHCKELKNHAKKFFKKQNIFFVGRGLDYLLALESSLKLKELSYIHSEAYAAGELKHGTISLIEKGVLVIAIATQRELFLKTLNNVKEVKARGAKILLICCEDVDFEENLPDAVLKIPNVDDFVAPFCAIVFMQLFACYVADFRGCDVDMPRNLAKSVTVE